MSIILNNLTKSFGPLVVVNKVTLEVADGELFVLLGGSGSGKSTILRLIAGLIRPDSGRIELHGRDVTDLPPQARNTGFVFQNYSIFRHMKVNENIEFGLLIRGVAAAERRQRRDELLDLVGLAGLGDRYAEQLSGGQQQRVALARALAYEPAVLLLDEPFGALDVKIRSQLRGSLKEIQRRLKVTTILVTHDQEEAFELADRIGVIDRGSLIEVGEPEQLYHRPRTEFAATFLGGGNVVVGKVTSGEIQLGSVRLPMPAGAPAHDDGAPLRVLFRPETVLAQAEPFEPQSGVHSLGQGLVVSQTFAGSLQKLLLEVSALQGARPLVPRPAYGQLAAVVEVARPSERTAQVPLRPGVPLWLGLKEYHVLAPTGLKVLIYADETPAGEAALTTGGRLAVAAGGPVTVLAVGDPQVTSPFLEAAGRAWLEALPRLELRARAGPAEREIVEETWEGHYELVVLGRGGDEPGGQEGIARSLLGAGVSVLLVREPPPTFRRILICTAAGEPGKSDVLFGGRVARRTGARATVLHVARPDLDGAAVERAKRHLARAVATLDALGVPAEAKVAPGGATAQILAEAQAGDYDLLVIGAPAPRSPRRLTWGEVTMEIVERSERPVLLVPMVE